MKVLGITGTNGAGKGTVVEYLSGKGYIHLSVGDYLSDMIKETGSIVNRDTLRETANQLRIKYGPAHIIEQLYMTAKKKKNNCIIESIRTVGEVEFLRRDPEFILLGVDADPRIRYKRIKLRQSDKDSVSYEKFLDDERLEADNAEAFKQNIIKCLQMADYKIYNNGGLTDLYLQIDRLPL
jgi:hypothetical protein